MISLQFLRGNFEECNLNPKDVTQRNLPFCISKVFVSDYNAASYLLNFASSTVIHWNSKLFSLQTYCTGICASFV